MTEKYNITTSENALIKNQHTNFSGGNRNSSQENYSIKNINMILFPHQNNYTNFNYTKENTGSENPHIVLCDKFQYLEKFTHIEKCMIEKVTSSEIRNKNI